MESTKKVFIDQKAELNFRKFKEGDHIIFLYGINENIVGLWDSHPINLEKFELTLPSNFQINGMILIYNDNVYEDFDSVIQTELEDLKAIRKNSNLISDRLFTFVMKDVLYLDDFDSIQYEKNVVFDLREDDLSEEEVVTVTTDISQKLKFEYFYLKSEIELCLISTQENSKNNFTLNLEDNLEKKFSSEFKNFFVFLKHPLDMLIDNIDLLNENNISHVTNLLTKLNISKQSNSISNILDFTLGVKDHKGDTRNFERLEILCKSDLVDCFKNTSVTFEIGGYVPKNLSGDNSHVFKNLVQSFKTNLTSIVNSLKSKQELIERISFENELFTTHTVFSEFSISKNGIDPMQELKNKDTLQTQLHLYSTKFINKNISKTNDYPVTRLVNVHSNINKEIGKYSKRFLVKGKYEYYHYGQDGCNDKNWGCAYRSLQTLYSWFLMNGLATKDVPKVPSITDIQKCLVKAGDKESKIIGSNDWIGAFEVSIVLNELLGVESQILYVSSGADLNSKGREIAHHFENNGSPIMIGGGVYAYTILGIEYDRVIGDCLFLILDPHYYGDDDVKTIINKGWCEWKTAALFQKENFYNMCMPQIPK